MVCPPIHEVLPESCFSLDELRETEISLNSSSPKGKKQKDSIPAATISASLRSLDLENKLDWWREDIQLSEHHANWHAYYPFPKKLDPNQRRGELFAYMHEQMLARYDFERFAVGLPPVVPYGPGIYWDKPLPEGYNIEIHRFSPRPGNMNIPDRILFPKRSYFMIKDMELHKERLLDAVARKKFLDSNGDRVPVTMDGLGCTVEADGNSVNPEYYGSLHNMGHVVISMMNDPDRRYGIHKGPMYQQYTAARDPVFFRWHKFIDSIFEAWRQQLKPRSLDSFKLADMSLSVEKVSVVTESNEDINGLPTENYLYTKMTKQTFTVYWAKNTTIAENKEHDKKKKHKKPYEKRYGNYPTLKHFAFDYHFTIALKKIDDSDINTFKLMFRVFIAPETEVTNLNIRRRHFVELDSFVHEIKWDPSKKGDTQTFDITRKSKDSTVAMQPIPSTQDISEGNLGNPKPFCGCGWPLNLLVPRGTPTGMKADLFVLVTDWREDAYDGYAELTSGSAYCGKSRLPYPDKKPMGYPFDRNFIFRKDKKIMT